MTKADTLDRLNYFKYMENLELPEDPTWVSSFNKFRAVLDGPTELDRGEVVKLLDPMDNFSVDYSGCWSGAHVANQTFWIPGTKMRSLTGKRPLPTIAMFLSDPDRQLRGSRIVHVCPDPYCCNPAHLYVVSNKCKILENVSLGIEDDEWPTIRRHICMLERHREEEQDVFRVAMDKHNGTPSERRKLEMSLIRNQNFFNLTNDEILMSAIQVGAKEVGKCVQYGSFASFLAEYHLLTAYNSLRVTDRDILEEMTSVKDGVLGTRELYIDALNYMAKHSPSGVKLTEALQALNLWRS